MVISNISNIILKKISKRTIGNITNKNHSFVCSVLGSAS